MTNFSPAPAHDTDILELLTQPEEVRKPSVTIGAKNEANSLATADESHSFPDPRRTHPVDLEVSTSSADGQLNGLHFLQQLLTNLQCVDGTAELMPQADASTEYVPLSNIDDIPHDMSTGIFVNSYLGLKPKGSVMKGTFQVRCNCKFEAFKKNAAFKSWLVGKIDIYTTRIDRMDLSGANRLFVGRFVNAVARLDLEGSFKERIIKEIVASKRCEGKKIPEFAVASKPWYNKNLHTRMFQVVAASPDAAKFLAGLLPILYPSSAVKPMFISEKVWKASGQPPKAALFDMHWSFMDDNCALLLKGVQDASQTITAKCGKKAITISAWLAELRTEEGSTSLFSSVFQNLSGEIELWVSIANQEEARIRLATVLVELAIMSGIDPSKEPEKAKAYFKNPLNVWRDVELNASGLSLVDQKNALSEFVLAIPKKAAGRNDTVKERFQRKPPKKRLQLVFNTNKVPEPPPSQEEVNSARERKLQEATKTRKARQEARRIVGFTQQEQRAGDVTEGQTMCATESVTASQAFNPRIENLPGGYLTAATVGAAIAQGDAFTASMAANPVCEPGFFTMGLSTTGTSTSSSSVGMRSGQSFSGLISRVAKDFVAHKKKVYSMNGAKLVNQMRTASGDEVSGASAAVGEGNDVAAMDVAIAESSVVLELLGEDSDDGGTTVSSSNTFSDVLSKRSRRANRKARNTRLPVVAETSTQEVSRGFGNGIAPDRLLNNQVRTSVDDARSISSAEADALRNKIELLRVSETQLQFESSVQKVGIQQLRVENEKLREVQATFEAASKIQAERLARLEAAVLQMSAPTNAVATRTTTDMVVHSPPRAAAGRRVNDIVGTRTPHTPQRGISSSAASLPHSGRGNSKKKRVYSPPIKNKFAALADDSDEEKADSPVASMCDFSIGGAEEYETAIEGESMDERDNGSVLSVLSDLSMVLEQDPDFQENDNTPSTGSNVAGMQV